MLYIFNWIQSRAPFHCSLMKEAADVMEDALKNVKIEMPCVEVISNVTAKPVSAS